MKYFVAIVLIAAVASASVIKPTAVSGELAEVQQIVAAINSPSTDPATAALLEQMLFETLGVSNPAPIAVGPAIVDSAHPIAVGPAIVDSIHPAVAAEIAEVQQIVDAINSPSTDPATAALLEEMLFEILGVSNPAPIAVGPAIVDSVHPIAVGPAIVDAVHPIAVGPAIVDSIHPIAVGPAIVDFPIPDGGVVSAVEPSPAVVAPAQVAPVEAPVAASTPLVQIILNINQAAAAGSPVTVDMPETPVGPAQPSPVMVEEAAQPEVIIPQPVIVVDSAPEVVAVVEESAPIVPAPVVLPEAVLPVVVLPEPVQVAEPIVPEPVQVAEPVIPEPVIVGTPILPAPAVVLPEVLN